MREKPFEFFCLCLVSFGLLFTGTALAADTTLENPPNILFILVDDMGWTGPGCYGSDLHETPVIDRLAKQGVRFTNAYAASPVCTPTRASIMTGKHPARLNMTIWHEAAVSRKTDPGDKLLAPPITEENLALEYTTLPEVLHNAGYQTAHIGKWHLGDAAHYPETQGFDVNIGATFWGAPRTYWYPYKGERVTSSGVREHRYVPGLPFGEKGEYLTDRLTDEAIAVMDRMQDGPFFLYMSYYAPHTPIEGKPELVAYYKKKIREGMDHKNARYAALVHNLDRNIGRLLDKLETLGIAENTMVVFFSDNGGFEQVRDGEQVTNNLPLRSGKGSLYEGGIRVPLIVRWPGVTRKGAVCATPVISMDFYPTVLEALGLDPEQPGISALDGTSLTPVLKNPSGTLNRDFLCFHYPHYYFTTTPVTAIRYQDWKLLEYYEDGHQELYNLADDLAESNDLAAKAPEKVQEIMGKLNAWKQQVHAQVPTPNKH